MTNTEITIHTDGCCLGNPGKGGFAAVVRRYENGVEIKKRVLSDNEPDTTNNRMELMAAITGLRQIKRKEPAKITVFSDSQYVVLGMTERLSKWQTKGWRTASGQPVKNREHWEELLAVSAGLDVQWEWVRGHNGDPRNEEADFFANQAASKQAR
ncbi:ribonuclease HI [Roseovarius marisflavi]|uniref:Ribonuclease H n=1 Tax=Roseovarius marisflavi TaxID=1054996 RepID=A0A1M6Z9B3_9RHOB|nr:ribonuclease HI [Roseovarius marisflavi]SHL27030.1 ribonuclease HI [Roseovarius marisflavi]